jgi:hypothetical protein
VHMVFAMAGGARAQGGEVLPGGEFELGLERWSQLASDGSNPFEAVRTPQAQGLSAGCDLPPGVDAHLELHLPLEEGQFVAAVPGPDRPGLRLEFGVWVWLESVVGSGEISLSVDSCSGLKTTQVVQSPSWRTEELPRERWLYLSTAGQQVRSWGSESGATELRYRLRCSAPGPVCFEGAAVRWERPGALEVPDASFEDWRPGSGTWEMSSGLTAGPTLQTTQGYYGPGFALLAEGSGALLAQTIELPGDPERGAPPITAGSYLEAGAWLHPDGFASLPQAPRATVQLQLSVYGIDDQRGTRRLLARGRWYPCMDDLGGWNFLQTRPLAPLRINETSLRVELRSAAPGSYAVDFVQLGERHGVDGNPQRRVGASYVGRYRSPFFPGATTTPTAPQEVWRNWRWVAPPACDNSYVGFAHDPDCGSNQGCFRGNGRRDLAIGTEGGPHELPLIGAYDSRDKAVLRYHVKLAESAGIDHFIFDFQGHKLADQLVAQGREPINRETFDALLQVTEEPGRNLKLAVMYEPKVHFLGWVQGEPTKADKIQGVVEDLVRLVQQVGGLRSVLRHDNRLVVFIFRNKTCNPAGTQCLDESDWLWIQAQVRNQTSEHLFLVGDSPPALGSALQGLTRWQLVSRSYLRYRNFTDAQLRLPTLPAASLLSLESHARGLTESVMEWRDQDVVERVAIQTVWPGFDDSGVGGWGVNNLMGEDGGPLCVRVAEEFEGQFYATTAAAALDSGADWIQIATFNDWNERTQIEPAWHPD